MQASDMEAVKGLQTSDFRLQTSDFRLQTSNIGSFQASLIANIAFAKLAYIYLLSQSYSN
jgi:hypothetical protein